MSQKKISRRKYIAAVGAAAAAVAIGGGAYYYFTSRIPTQKRVKITHWCEFDEQYKKVLPAFNKAYPYIDVEYLHLGWQEAQDKFPAALVAGTGLPSLQEYEAIFATLIDYKYPGKLLDLSDRIKPYTEYLDSSSIELLTKDSRIIGVPKDVNMAFVCYNKNILDKAGIDAEDLVTWDDWIEAGKKIVYEKRLADCLFVMDPAIAGMESYTLTPSWDKDLYPLFDQDFKVRVLDNLCKARLKHKLVRDAVFFSAEYWDAYRKEQAVMYGHCVWGWYMRLAEIVPELKGKMRLGLPPVHAPENKARGAGYAKYCHMIPAEIPDDEKEAAWNYLKFLFCDPDEAKKAWQSIPIEEFALVWQGLPANKALADLLTPYSHPYFGGQKIYEVLKTSLENAEPQYFPPEAQEIHHFYGVQAELALKGKKTAREACEAVQQKALALRKKRLEGTL